MNEPLLIEARKFNKQALVSAYERFSPPLFRYAFRLLGESDLAEECVAECFSRFLHALKDGGGPNERLQAYLFRIAHNWITDYYRRQPPPAEPLEFAPLVDRAGNPAQIVSQKFEQERVRNALLRLTADQQKVIILKFLEGWNYEEAAAALGKTVEATRVLQHRALAMLRRSLIEEEE
jgi:RNA polymerase sigma-70 factor (ECF subfamily)